MAGIMGGGGRGCLLLRWEAHKRKQYHKFVLQCFDVVRRKNGSGDWDMKLGGGKEYAGRCGGNRDNWGGESCMREGCERGEKRKSCDWAERET